MTADPHTSSSSPEGGSNGLESTADRWLGDSQGLEAPLPSDVRTGLGRLLGADSIETLAEWIAEVRRRTGGPIAVDDLCHADEETPHWGEVDGERHYFRCFYDAVVLSALVERPVAIRTESPAGTEIEARAAGGTDLTVVPETAAFSFGVDESVSPPPDGEPSHADVYAAVCPFVRAFPDRESYDRWADAVPAATVAMPLEGATELAAALLS